MKASSVILLLSVTTLALVTLVHAQSEDQCNLY